MLSVTDYQYHTKTSFCLTCVPPCFLTSYVLLLVRHRRQSLATYFYVFILLEFRSFTIKSLMQFLTLQKLTLSYLSTDALTAYLEISSGRVGITV